MVSQAGFTQYPGVTAHRQPDITIPLFTPNYTLDFLASGNTSANLRSNSLYPLIVPEARQGAGTSVGQLFDFAAYAPAPFGYGLTYGNKSILLLGSQTAAPTFGPLLRWGNLLFSMSTNAKSLSGIQHFYWDLTAIATASGGLEIDAGISANTFDTALSGAGTFISAFMCAMQSPFSGGTVAFCVQSHNGINNPGESFVDRFPIQALNLAHDQKNYWHSMNAPNGLWAVNGAIPDLGLSPGDNPLGPGIYTTWIWTQTSAFQFYVGPIAFDTGKGWIYPVTFDDATVNARFNGTAGNSVQSTNFGWLMSNNGAQIIAGQPNYLLLSKDGKFYSLIRFSPQSNGASNAMQGSGLVNVPAMIDPQGTFYVINKNSVFGTKQVLNSYALNIPWNPITLPTLALPNITIPGLCGCIPGITG